MPWWWPFTKTYPERVKPALQIVEEIYSEGRSIVGSRWTLLAKMRAFAREDDLNGMHRYYIRCTNSRRGVAVAARLRAAGKKTLESEEKRFLEAVRLARQSPPHGSAK